MYLCMLFIIMAILYDKQYIDFKSKNIERIANVSTMDSKAIKNLVSLYNSKSLTIENSNVTKSLKVGNNV